MRRKKACVCVCVCVCVLCAFHIVQFYEYLCVYIA
jgi:hypothetical protein